MNEKKLNSTPCSPTLTTIDLNLNQFYAIFDKMFRSYFRANKSLIECIQEQFRKSAGPCVRYPCKKKLEKIFTAE